jgi:two-component system chemotaxis sensor kinase CheA
LFDPAGIAHVGGIKLEMHERGGRVVEDEAAQNDNDISVLLFRGMDGGRRAMRLAIVERIEEVPVSAVKRSAGKLRVQLGETILPLVGLEAAQLPAGKIRLFRLNDGESELGYAFQEVIDMSSIGPDVINADSPGEVSGVTLIGGEPAELVDAHWLFATHRSQGRRGKKMPVCKLPTDDTWMQNMLRPIVEAAGYRVIGDDADEKADLVIASDNAAVPASVAGTVIRLRATPETANAQDSSIYRYDRAGLLMALHSAGGKK